MTRRVPLARRLADMLQGLLEGHPGGSSLFCQSGAVEPEQEAEPDDRT